MLISHSGHWPFLSSRVPGVFRTVLSLLRRRRSTPRSAVPAPGYATGEPLVNPRELSDGALRAELLAALPVDPCEPGLVADADCSNALPPVAETAVARKLSVAREMLRRQLLAELRARPVMEKPDKLGEWLCLHCAELDYEVFLVLYLDAQHRLIAIEQLFRGTLTQCHVYPREVLKRALAHGAAVLAVAHNHPSGSPEPSMADQHLTRQLKSALSLIDVRVMDHIVVAGDRHYSFAEHGLI